MFRSVIAICSKRFRSKAVLSVLGLLCLVFIMERTRSSEEELTFREEKDENSGQNRIENQDEKSGQNVVENRTEYLDQLPLPLGKMFNFCIHASKMNIRNMIITNLTRFVSFVTYFN